MTAFVSYAQNFEDVMLWRALKHVESGLYIDLGAQDPVVDSVSLAFHERGWKGIHIEPTPHYAQLLRDQRPGDTVIEAAISNVGDMLTFFEIPGTGISTADPQIAQQHRERGYEPREITVPCVRLSSVFKTCGNQDIHWMKIDVEGFEWHALASWGKSPARPWIVVVESTLPLTQIESHEQWEPLLLRRGYTPVYFDGLNRYYVAEERIELKRAFYAPPNIFDDFSVSGTASTTLHRHLQARHAAEVAEIGMQMKRANSDIEGLKQTLTTRDLVHEEQMRERLAHLNARSEEVLQLERARSEREEAVSANSSQLGQQKEELLHRIVALERDAATALMALRKKTDDERTQFHRQYSERESALQNLHAERERELRTQLARQKEDLLRQLMGLQEEAATRILQLERKWDSEREQLQLRHSERESALQLRYAERETALEVHWQSLQKESARQLDEFQKKLDIRQAETTRHAESVAGMMRQLAERETANGMQLLSTQHAYEHQLETIRQETAADRARLANEHAQQVSVLQRQLSHAELSLIQQRLQMEQDAVRKLEAIRSEVAVNRFELLRTHSAEVSTLKLALQTREREFGAWMLEAQKQASEVQHQLQADAANRLAQQSRISSDESALFRQNAEEREKYLQQQLVSAQNSLLERQQQEQALSDNYRKELTARDQQAKAVETSMTARELALLNQLEGLQGVRLDLLQSLHHLRIQVLGMQSTLSWRATAPARMVVSFLFPSKGMWPQSDHGFISPGFQLDLNGNSFLSSFPLAHCLAPPEITMTSTTNSIVPGTLEDSSAGKDLLALDHQEFLRDAYRLVLGRDVDAAGRTHFLDKLRSGIDKLQILAELRISPEGSARAAAVPQLDEDLVIATHAKAVVSTLEELVGCQGRAFVRAAYLTLLGREPDVGGMESCVRQLRNGAAKVEILAQMQRSVEGQSRTANLQVIADAMRRSGVSNAVSTEGAAAPQLGSRERLRLTATPTIDDLQRCDDSEFIRLGFWVLLGRWPDPVAFATYSKHLVVGNLRIQLLAEIARSSEAIGRAGFAVQIDQAIRHYRFATTPFIRPIARIFLRRVEKVDQESRNLRGVQFENSLRLERLEQRIAQIDYEIVSVSTKLQGIIDVSLQNRAGTDDTSRTDRRLDMHVARPTLSGMSAHARGIYARLASTWAAKHEVRK